MRTQRLLGAAPLIVAALLSAMVAAEAEDDLATFTRLYVAAKAKGNKETQGQLLKALGDSAAAGRVRPKDGVSALAFNASGEKDPEVLSSIVESLGAMNDVSAVDAIRRIVSPYLTGFVLTARPEVIWTHEGWIGEEAEKRDHERSRNNSIAGSMCSTGIAALRGLEFPESIDLLLEFAGKVHDALPPGGDVKETSKTSRPISNEEAVRIRNHEVDAEAWKTLHGMETSICSIVREVTGQDDIASATWTCSEWRTWWAQHRPGTVAPSPESPPKEPSEADVEEARATGLLTVAEQFLKNNMRDRAIEKLREILDTYPNTRAAAAAKQRLEELKVDADTK